MPRTTHEIEPRIRGLVVMRLLERVLRDNTRVPYPYHHRWNTGDTQDWHKSFATMHVVISRTRTASTLVIHPGAYPLTHTDSVNVCSILNSIHYYVVHKINASIQVQPPELNLTCYRKHSGSIRQFTETFLVILFHNIEGVLVPSLNYT